MALTDGSLEYQQMKKTVLRGWNTWNTWSILSHVHLPEGFAINLCLKDTGKSAYLKEADVGNKDEKDAAVFPYEHAYDGSYTRLRLSWNGVEIEVASAVEEDQLVLLVTPLALPDRPVLLVAELAILWNRPGALVNNGDEVYADCGGKIFRVYTTGERQIDPYIRTQTPYIATGLNGPVGFSTGIKRGVPEIQAVIARAARRHAERAESFGELKEVYKAMQTCMAWDTVYEPAKDRMVSTVSRRWNKFWSGYVLFCWDNYFAAQIAAVDSKEIAYSNLIEMTAERTEAGFVPNFASALGASSRDRSQPPVGAASLLEVYKIWKEKWIVEYLFEALAQWNDWWFEHRQIEPGLFAWGSDPYTPRVGHYSEREGVNGRFGAALESGLDNSPMYDDIPFDQGRHMLLLADVGLTGLVILDCRALLALSEVIGDQKRGAIFRERLALCERAIQRLWCEEDGFFYNLRTDTGEFSKRISPTNFYALYSSSVTERQARRVIEEHFYNPQEYWGDYILPSIARNDPAYPEQDYWRGRIWPPMNFLVYGALKARSLDGPARDLAERSAKLILKEWLEKGHVHENYCADTGEGCNVWSSDSFYHWGGLLGLIALREAKKV